MKDDRTGQDVAGVGDAELAALASAQIADAGYRLNHVEPGDRDHVARAVMVKPGHDDPIRSPLFRLDTEPLLCLAQRLAREVCALRGMLAARAPADARFEARAAIEVRTAADIVSDLLDFAEAREWSDQIHDYGDYFYAGCDACEARESDGEHGPRCTRKALLLEARAFMSAERSAVARAVGAGRPGLTEERPRSRPYIAEQRQLDRSPVYADFEKMGQLESDVIEWLSDNYEPLKRRALEAYAREDLPAALAEIERLGKIAAGNAALEASQRAEIERLTAELAARAPADASLEARAKCCDFPSPSVHDGQPYCEACDTDLVPARAVVASRPGLTEEQIETLAKTFDARAESEQALSGKHREEPEEWVHGAASTAWYAAAEDVRALLRASRGETGPAPTWGEQAIAEHRRAALDPEDGTLCADCRAPRNTIHGALCSVRAGAKPGRVHDPRATLHDGDPQKTATLAGGGTGND